MIKNYFRIGWRNLLSNKTFSLINILGLALGMACSLVIVLWLNDELKKDRFHANDSRLYRVMENQYYSGEISTFSSTPGILAEHIVKDIPEIQYASQMLWEEEPLFTVGNILDKEKGRYVQKDFLRMFSFNLTTGDKNTALDRPDGVVISKKLADKYFPGQDPMNKIIRIDNADNVVVTGLLDEIPETSSLEFEFLMSYERWQKSNDWAKEWGNNGPRCYVLLAENADIDKVNAKIKDYIKTKNKDSNVVPTNKPGPGSILKTNRFSHCCTSHQAAGNGYRYYLQALKDIHLNSRLEGELKPNGSRVAVYAFGIIALFILILAIINFVNLSTARSGERAREVGIRKTFGSGKNSLVVQFLSEAVLMGMASLFIAAGLVYLVLPLFNQLSGKTFSINDLLTGSNIVLFSSMALGTGLLAGLYPAFVLASFKPIQVLKGKLNSSGYGMTLRNGLVVFQFSISMVLIICTLIVNRQMNYMTSNNLGYNKDFTVLIQRTDLLGPQTQAFKNALRQVPGVINVSGASAFPGDPNYFGISWREAGSKEPMTGRGVLADDQYQSLFELELREGRFFSKEYGTDSLAVVLNEAAVKELGLANPIGARLFSEEDFLNGPDNQPYEYRVIGVLKDYNYQNLHLPIVPLVFTSTSRFQDVTFSTAVKLKGQDMQPTLQAMEMEWKKFVQDRPFHYEFLDKTIARQYEAETRTRSIFSFFAGLAIFIACMGLLGLAAYATQQRMKEISMRKVMGASTLGIVGLLSKNFLKLIGMAILVAFPLAWYAMSRWLQGFSYRVDPSWWIFVLAAVGTLGIALLTLGVQAYRAGRVNIIKTLRTE